MLDFLAVTASLCLANKVVATTLRCNLFSTEKAQKGFSAPQTPSWVSEKGRRKAEMEAWEAVGKGRKGKGKGKDPLSKNLTTPAVEILVVVNVVVVMVVV